MDISRFELIDGVVAVSRDLSRLTCLAAVPTSSSLFDGHFPGDPLLPGTVSLEVMAQAAGFLAMLQVRLEKMGYLLAVDNARFRAVIRPGTRLTAVATLRQLGSGYAAFACTLEADSGRAASADIRIKLSDFANDMLRRSMLERLSSLGLTARVTAASAELGPAA